MSLICETVFMAWQIILTNTGNLATGPVSSDYFTVAVQGYVRSL